MVFTNWTQRTRLSFCGEFSSLDKTIDCYFVVNFLCRTKLLIIFYLYSPKSVSKFVLDTVTVHDYSIYFPDWLICQWNLIKQLSCRSPFTTQNTITTRDLMATTDSNSFKLFLQQDTRIPDCCFCKKIFCSEIVHNCLSRFYFKNKCAFQEDEPTFIHLYVSSGFAV